MSDKLFVASHSLLLYSLRLGNNVFQSGFIPTHVLAIWRGGSPIGIAVLELLRIKGVHPFHTVVKTESYIGTTQQDFMIIEGVEKISQKLTSGDKLLIIDDIFDTGNTIQSIIRSIREKTYKANPEIRVATVFYNRQKNQTNIEPDYYIKEVDSWVVFPHELEGLTKADIKNKEAGIFELIYGDDHK